MMILSHVEGATRLIMILLGTSKRISNTLQSPTTEPKVLFSETCQNKKDGDP